MAAIWKADRMSENLGQPEMRGFGARVYFYNTKSQAVPVEGDLVVHGYVTTPSSRREPREQSDRKFTFTSEQLASQFSPSDMGASYSIWIPWDEDGYREEVTLIATFKSKKGTVVQGSPTKVNLPGKSPVPNETAAEEKFTKGVPAQQVSYSRASIPTYDIAPSPDKMPSTRVTTIDLPRQSRLTRPSTPVSVGAGSLQGLGNATNSMDTNSGIAPQGVEVGGQRSLQPNTMISPNATVPMAQSLNSNSLPGYSTYSVPNPQSPQIIGNPSFQLQTLSPPPGNAQSTVGTQSVGGAEASNNISSNSLAPMIGHAKPIQAAPTSSQQVGAGAFGNPLGWNTRNLPSAGR